MLKKFEVMENIHVGGKIELMAVVEIDVYEIRLAREKASPEEVKRIIAEHITNQIIKEFEKRDI